MTLRKRVTAICMALTLLLCFGGQHAQAVHNRDRTLTVMTRNMYLGTDFDEILLAQTGGQLVQAVTQAYAEVEASKIPERIAAMADEIEAAQPVLVGLQEVTTWRVGQFGDPAQATTVTYDFLQLLHNELRVRGLHYETVKELTNFDSPDFPAFSLVTGEPFDLRYTDRDVVLARTDLKTSQFKLGDVQAQHFTTNFIYPPPDSPPNPLFGRLTIPRGWISVDAKMRGKDYRFVNTHLESFSPLVQYYQAQELLQTAGSTELPVIFAGDFNSDAESYEPTYQLLLSAGFVDAWEVTHPDEPGFTWPLFLTNPFTYTAPTQRIDLVLTRGEIEALAVDVVGEENVTPSKPMPSDHAGVVATLKLEP